MCLCVCVGWGMGKEGIFGRVNKSEGGGGNKDTGRCFQRNIKSLNDERVARPTREITVATSLFCRAITHAGGVVVCGWCTQC